MKQLKLSSKEIERMRSFYITELDEAIKYVEQVRQILSKLGSPATSAKAEIPANPTLKKRGRPRKVKASEPQEGKLRKRGRPRKEKPENAEQTGKKTISTFKNNKRKGRRKKTRGVFLQNLSKPLPKKTLEEIEQVS